MSFAMFCSMKSIKTNPTTGIPKLCSKHKLTFYNFIDRDIRIDKFIVGFIIQFQMVQMVQSQPLHLYYRAALPNLVS